MTFRGTTVGDITDGVVKVGSTDEVGVIDIAGKEVVSVNDALPEHAIVLIININTKITGVNDLIRSNAILVNKYT
jgi:hypothetical protein